MYMAASNLNSFFHSPNANVFQPMPGLISYTRVNVSVGIIHNTCITDSGTFIYIHTHSMHVFNTQYLTNGSNICSRESNNCTSTLDLPFQYSYPEISSLTFGRYVLFLNKSNAKICTKS